MLPNQKHFQIQLKHRHSDAISFVFELKHECFLVRFFMFQWSRCHFPSSQSYIALARLRYNLLLLQSAVFPWTLDFWTMPSLKSKDNLRAQSLYFYGTGLELIVRNSVSASFRNIGILKCRTFCSLMETTSCRRFNVRVRF